MISCVAVTQFNIYSYLCIGKYEKMKLKQVVILLFPLLLTGCRTERGATETASAEVLQLDKEQVWQLVEIRGKAVPGSVAPTTLIFHPESGTVRGRVACNRYFADYSAGVVRAGAVGTDFKMNITYPGGGDVQCPEADMAMQERYLGLLAKTASCTLTRQSLTLFHKNREPLLKFELQ